MMYQPRGKVLGGTSSINGMIYMRGNPPTTTSGASAAAKAGTTIPCCRISARRRTTNAAPSEFHGAGGPLRVSNQPYEWEIGRLLLQACIQAGIPPNPDFNGAQQAGATMLIAAR